MSISHIGESRIDPIDGTTLHLEEQEFRGAPLSDCDEGGESRTIVHYPQEATARGILLIAGDSAWVV